MASGKAAPANMQEPAFGIPAAFILVVEAIADGLSIAGHSGTACRGRRRLLELGLLHSVALLLPAVLGLVAGLGGGSNT